MDLFRHSRAWLPREESRSFAQPGRQEFSGFLARARNAHGNDKERAALKVACHYIVQYSIERLPWATIPGEERVFTFQLDGQSAAHRLI